MARVRLYLTTICYSYTVTASSNKARWYFSKIFVYSRCKRAIWVLHFAGANCLWHRIEHTKGRWEVSDCNGFFSIQLQLYGKCPSAMVSFQSLSQLQLQDSQPCIAALSSAKYTFESITFWL